MAKKDNAIYAPGELTRVREKLGVTDLDEAKRMMQVLGGEVGSERDSEIEKARRTKRETVELVVSGKFGKKPARRIETADIDEVDGKTKAKTAGFFPGDDPAIPLKLKYSERVKMDQLAGQIVFDIKTSFQVLTSVLSFFKEPTDYINHRFVVKRMNEYYNKVEKLVMSVRTLFSKKDAKRNNRLKRVSPFVFKMLDIMRNWNIEKIAKSIANLQTHPRNVKNADFIEVLQEIYKPLFILSDLSIDDIKTAFKLIYKVLYLESPIDAKDKYQDLIRTIISSVIEVRRDVQFGMYPILMKQISDRFIPYERFFIERRNCFINFLGVTESDQLDAEELNQQKVESINTETLAQNLNEESDDETEGSEAIEEDPNDPKVIERKAKEEKEKAERKAIEQGETALEVLFPRANWHKLEEFPDLYPYFAKLYNLRGGYELISPDDPLQQVFILMHILDDLFIGLRSVNFGTIIGADGVPVKLNEELADIVYNWRLNTDESFSKEYLPRLTEYCRLLENSGDARSSPYAKKKMNELHWIKRLYFLPYYKFDSIGPPPLQKNEVIPIYSHIRKLRQYLTAVAMGIEQGTRAGGVGEKIQCEGINNPWEPYNFQIPNVVSKRMELLFPPERKTNSTIVFFSLSAITILDYIVNNENSWAYGIRPEHLFRSIFRSVRGEGIIPVFGVDEKIDADQIFKDSLKKKSQ